MEGTIQNINIEIKRRAKYVRYYTFNDKRK